jgi:predicted MFS family arabinose efflux permease
MSGTRRPAAAIARRSPDRMLTRLARLPRRALPARLNVLRDRPFRLFLLAQLTSWLGDFTAAPALAFAVLDLHGTPDDIGIVLAARSVPLVLFMLLGGVVADRLPRHLVMLGADVVRVVTQAATALLVIDGSGPLWGVAVLQFLGGSASAMFTPAVSGLMQTMVEPEQRQAANSLRSTSQSAAMVAGPLLSALLTLTLGAGWAIAVDAASFAVSAVCLGLLRLPPGTVPSGPWRVLSGLRTGWQEFRSRTWVWSMIATASLSNMLYAVFTVLGPVVSERELGGRGAWGVIIASFGAGAVLGSTAGVWLRPRRPLLTASLVVALVAAPPLALSLTGALLPVVAAAFAAGAALMLFSPLWETVLQREIPADRLSRVSAYEWFGSYAAQPLGLAFAGPLAAAAGARTALLAAGAVQFAVCLAPLAVKDVRTYEAPTTDAPDAGQAQGEEKHSDEIQGEHAGRGAGPPVDGQP